MNPTTLASQNIAAIGTFLTLTSLLGTFFYVQLSTWLRDLLTLKAKFDLNDGGNTDDEKKAIREVRPLHIYQQAVGANNWPFAAAISVVFMIAVLVIVGALGAMGRKSETYART